MIRRVLLTIGVFVICCNFSYAKWAEITNVKMMQEQTKLGGPKVIIEYDLNEPDISKDCPVYVFVRYSIDSGASWKLLPMQSLRGDGFELVDSPGHKKIILWGASEIGFDDVYQVEFKVRAIKMVHVPGGKFIMKSIPSGGNDTSKSKQAVSSLPSFYIAKNKTTISMYVDYLNEVGGDGTGWNRRMANELRCGIVQNSDHTYSTKPGRENYPITYTSWYDAVAFLQWCGLRLPTEAEWEKAFRGGTYLDGDNVKKQKNPLPERKYPWGNESPDACGVYRCNYNGADDGFEYTAPVGSFDRFNSPYGACDMAGNVAEWTLDWYSTSYHAGLDGFRMVRGGSWMAVPSACDAVTGTTRLPIKESSIMGFRGVRQ